MPGASAENVVSTRTIAGERVVYTRRQIGHARLTREFLLTGDPPSCALCQRAISLRRILIDCDGFNSSRTFFFLSRHSFDSYKKIFNELRPDLVLASSFF